MYLSGTGGTYTLNVLSIPALFIPPSLLSVSAPRPPLGMPLVSLASPPPLRRLSQCPSTFHGPSPHSHPLNPDREQRLPPATNDTTIRKILPTNHRNSSTHRILLLLHETLSLHRLLREQEIDDADKEQAE